MKLQENHYYLGIDIDYNCGDTIYQLLDVTDIESLSEPIFLIDSDKIIKFKRSDEVNYRILKHLMHNEHTVRKLDLIKYNDYSLYGYDIKGGVLIYSCTEINNFSMYHTKMIRQNLDDEFIEKVNERLSTIINKLSAIGWCLKCNIQLASDEILVDCGKTSSIGQIAVQRVIDYASRERIRFILNGIDNLKYFIHNENVIEVNFYLENEHNITDELIFNNKNTCMINDLSYSKSIKCDRIEFNGDVWINPIISKNDTKLSITTKILKGSKHIKYMSNLYLKFECMFPRLDLRGIICNYTLANVIIVNVDVLILNNKTLSKKEILKNKFDNDFVCLHINKVISSNINLYTNKLHVKEEIIYYNKDYDSDLIEFSKLHLKDRFSRVANQDERIKYHL